MFTHMVALFKAIRPKTLTAALVPILVGSSLSYTLTGSVDTWVGVTALLSAICIQIATNLFNDAIDFVKGADGKDRLGPQRATQMGWFKQRTVYLFAFGFSALAAILGWPLVAIGGWPIVCIGILSLLLAYGYTGGPFPLAYQGFGDLFVMLFFGWIAVMAVVYLHTGLWSGAAFVAGTQVGAQATVLIAINNLRDRESDRLVNKKTLAVRYGLNFGRLEISVLMALSYLLGVYWWQLGEWAAALLPLLSLPLAVFICIRVGREAPSAGFNRYLGLAALNHLLLGSLLSIGLLRWILL